MELEHLLLALEALFTEDEVTALRIGLSFTLSGEELARIGLAQRNSDGKPQFIHRTFAEYFVADFLIKHLKEKTEQHEQVQNFLLNKILLADYQGIRAFFDGLLKNLSPSEEVLKYYGEKFNEWSNERENPKYATALHLAATEDNAHIVEFIFQCIKSTGILNNLHPMMFAKNDRGRNALYLAGANGSLLALDTLVEWNEKVHQPSDITSFCKTVTA
jgi:hypothetical protein